MSLNIFRNPGGYWSMGWSGFNSFLLGFSWHKSHKLYQGSFGISIGFIAIVFWWKYKNG